MLGATIIAPWQLGGTASVSIPNPDGTERQIHFIKSSPQLQGMPDHPDKEIFFVCEWRDGKYGPPPETPPAGCHIAPIFGSNRGDSGWRLPGEKHGFIWPRIRQYSYTSRVLQVLYSTRMPDAPSGAPFYLVLVNLPIVVPPVVDWASVANTLKTDIAALRRDVQRALGLEQRIDALEKALGKGGDAALEGRVVALENVRAGFKKALE